MKIRDILNKSCDWLIRQQDVSGGWAAQPGNSLSTLNTAEAVIALIDSGHLDAGHESIRKAVDFLESHQISDGVNQGAWPRDIDFDNKKIPDIIRTTFVVQALIRCSNGVDNEIVKNGISWLINVQRKSNGDFGWGFRRDQPTHITPTCFALLTLLRAYKAGCKNCRDNIENGIQTLCSEFYDQQECCFGHQEQSKPIHTILAILALQMARKNNLINNSLQELEGKSTGWILKDTKKALNVAEERIEIDSSGRANYCFLYTSDTLFLNVLYDSCENIDQKLIDKVLLSILSRCDKGTGGFYRDRTFSWSTSKAVLALKNYKAFNAPSENGSLKRKIIEYFQVIKHEEVNALKLALFSSISIFIYFWFFTKK